MLAAYSFIKKKLPNKLLLISTSKVRILVHLSLFYWIGRGDPTPALSAGRTFNSEGCLRRRARFREVDDPLNTYALKGGKLIRQTEGETLPEMSHNERNGLKNIVGPDREELFWANDVYAWVVNSENCFKILLLGTA